MNYISINHFNFLNVRTFTYPEIIKPESANFSRRAELFLGLMKTSEKNFSVWLPQILFQMRHLSSYFFDVHINWTTFKSVCMPHVTVSTFCRAKMEIQHSRCKNFCPSNTKGGCVVNAVNISFHLVWSPCISGTTENAGPCEMQDLEYCRPNSVAECSNHYVSIILSGRQDMHWACSGVRTVAAESRVPEWDQRNSVATCNETNLAHFVTGCTGSVNGGCSSEWWSGVDVWFLSWVEFIEHMSDAHAYKQIHENT